MKLVDFIVCDDIRQEISNKISVMGIFGNELRVQMASQDETWPVSLRLGVYVRVVLDNDDALPNRVQIKASRGDSEVVLADGALTIQDRRPILTVPIVLPQFVIMGPGAVTFECLFTRDTAVVGTFSQTVGISIEPRQIAAAPSP